MAGSIHIRVVPMATRVAVFIEYQNAYMGVRSAMAGLIVPTLSGRSTRAGSGRFCASGVEKLTPAAGLSMSGSSGASRFPSVTPGSVRLPAAGSLLVGSSEGHPCDSAAQVLPGSVAGRPADPGKPGRRASTS